MRIVGLMKARNEEWVVGLTLPAALEWVHAMVVLDHASTDGTRRIVEETARERPGEVTLLTHDDPTWTEAAINQRLLDAGRRVNGDVFAMIDADEVLTGSLLPVIRGMTAGLDPGGSLHLPWIAMWRGLDQHRDDDSIWGRNSKILMFRDGEKVCFKAHDDGCDIHTRYPRGLTGAQVRPWEEPSRGGVMHLQFAHWRRLVAKHAWYKMIETVRFPGRATAQEIDALYNQALNERKMRTRPAPPEWWAPYGDLRSRVDLTSVPWHEEECRRLWEEHGAEAFKGLTLWGIPTGASEHPAGEKAGRGRR